MLYEYMTSCSSIRAYHQMTTARGHEVNTPRSPRLIEWLDGIGEKLPRDAARDAPRDAQETEGKGPRVAE
jgi:hypothetical protein